jgi:hypothetical protein
MEVYLYVHCGKFIGHVAEHIGKGNLTAIVIIADSAVDFLINAKLRVAYSLNL